MIYPDPSSVLVAIFTYHWAWSLSKIVAVALAVVIVPLLAFDITPITVSFTSAKLSFEIATFIVLVVSPAANDKVWDTAV